jgi:hypothetical protein
MQGEHSQHEQHIISDGYPTIRYPQVICQLLEGVQFCRNRTPELFSDALKELYSGCFGVLAHGASQPWKSNFLNWRVVSPKHVLGSLQGTALDVLATQFRKDS